MDAVTYPQKAVQEFLADSMVAVRIPFDSPLSQEFRVTWLPMLITLDWNGAEHDRTVGFMAPAELVPSLMLSCAKVYCDCGLFDKAFARLGKLSATCPESDTAAEAMFFHGVCSYKSTHDPATLKEAFQKLTEHYPHSQWTKRAYPYRLL